MDIKFKNCRPHLIVCAHRGEARSFVNTLAMRPSGRPNLLESAVSNHWLLITGEGEERAMSETAYALGTLQGKIERVVNYGVAASLIDSLKPDAILEIRTIYAADHGQRPKFKSFTTDLAAAHVDCVSASDRVLTHDDRSKLVPIADLVDREAWGIAWAAHCAGLPFGSVKYISDKADQNTNCDLIKAGADRFSEALKNHFINSICLQQETPIKPSDNCDWMLPREFHATATQRKEITKLLRRLAGRNDRGVRAFFDDLQSAPFFTEIQSKDLAPKMRTKQLIDCLHYELNPHLMHIRQSCMATLAQFNCDALRVSIDPMLEEHGFAVQAKLDDQSQAKHLGEAIGLLPFAEIAALLDGEDPPGVQ